MLTGVTISNRQQISDQFSPFDAVLLFSFGGPNRPEDVLPFLKNVTEGKNIPDERLVEVGEHYMHYGGKSPINEQNLALSAALQQELTRRGSDLPVLWTNRNWHPFIEDTLRDAVAFGAKKLAVLVTSAFASYSGDRQYREALAKGLEASGVDVEFFKIRPYFNDPGFVSANLNELKTTLVGMPEDTHVVFVTHSIPDTMELASGVTGPSYVAQHEDVREVIMQQLQRDTGVTHASSLAYCSRSGPPSQPWLEPDINDHLEELAASGVNNVVVSVIGFISDHMEVVYDIDTEAAETAARLGLNFRRAASAGVHPDFVAGLVDLLAERAARERGAAVQPKVVGQFTALPDHAPLGSCYRIHEQPSGLPALCGED